MTFNKLLPTERLPLCVLALAIALGADATEAASPKLGWAGGSAADHNASNSSWYYRWWHNIPASADGSLADFVPLIKYPNNIQNKVNEVASIAGTDTLLVLNEPERDTQSDTTVQEALDIWPTIQNSLPNHRLVGPGFGDDQGGREWMDEFMAEVDSLNGNADPNDDIRLDAVAFHWYGASSPNGVSAANNFLNRVDFFHNRYNRPIWITEFAMHDWEGNDPTAAMIQANADFLEIVIPALESRSYVERYSYYNWFDDARVFTDVDPAPTVIGDQYVGTLLPGESRDLSGQSLGLDVVYLRGGTLTNTGAAVPDAMRAIDALGGVSTISGTGDWSTAFRRDSYARVRDGATLIKDGSAAFELRAPVTVEGTLRVVEGTLSLFDGSLRGGGTTVVDQGATLAVSFNGGRSPYSVSGHQIDLTGEIEGNTAFSGGSALTTHGDAARVSGSLTVGSSTLTVGGEGFEPGNSSVSPVAAGLVLDYDAALDVSGDNVWDNAAGGANAVTFGQPSSVIPVTDASFPGLSAAYANESVGGAEGLNGFFEQGGPARSRQDATFEVVFRIDDTNAGTDQVLMEVGGAARGVAFVLNGDQLTFNVDGDAADINLTQTLDAGWHQAVGVIDVAGGSDTVTLFLNGEEVSSLGGQTIGDWAGGNISGVGKGSSSVTGVSSGTGSPFHGDLAITRYYQNNAFTSAEAMQNYLALTSAGPRQASLFTVDASLTAGAGGEIRLDIGDAQLADKIMIGENLVLTGGALSVTYVGEDGLAAGDLFDLFDFAAALGEFDGIGLPELAGGLMWNVDRLTADGSLLVTIAGDYNGDGTVDAADYSVWRDAAGSDVDALTSADGNGDGQVDAADLAVWQGAYGQTIASMALSVVPEPASALSLLTAFVFAGCLKPRTRS